LTKTYVIIAAVTRILSELAGDAAHALRLLTRRRAFALTAIATLALGLGAPTTIFSVVHAVLLRPLPYPDADRIVRFRIESRTPRGQQVAFDALPATAALEWASTSASLSSIALYNDAARTLTTPDGPVRLTGLAATPNLFDLLGTAPTIGHTFGSDDRDVRQIVLSHATWQQYFDGATSVVGSLVTLDGQAHRIVGVMPREFEFPSRETRFWLPVVLSSGGSRGMLLPAIARMKPDANLASVMAEGRRVLTERGGERQNLIVRTLRDHMVGSVRRLLWVLMAAVSLVSAIAIVNLALLLLTQGASRSGEFSVRLALGGSRARLIRQVAVEGLALATVGGVAGLIFASLFLRVLVGIAPPDVPRLHQTSFDAQVLAFGGALVFVVSVLFAIVSAGSVVAGDAIRSVMGAGTESRLLSTAASRRRLNGLAAAELALAVVLLVGAGLLLRSFVRLVMVDQGFDPRGALAAQVTLPSARYPTPASRMDFHERLLGRLRELRGPEHVGLITSMPNRQPTGRFAYDPVGVAMFPDPFTMQVAEVRMATEGLIEAMGIPLVAGRTLVAADSEGAEPVMVISDELARHHFPDASAVGRMLYSGSGNRRVVGVVGTVKSATAAGAQHNPSAYLPLRQNLDVFEQFATMSIVVRGRDPLSLGRDLRSIVRSLDPELAMFNVRTLEDETNGLVAGPRFSATVLGLFAVVAVVMAAVGVYGVIAYGAARRTREIGVRIALGATRAQILRLIVREGVIVIVAGLSCGLVAAVWLARTLTGLLHEIAPADPIALISVAALLSIVGAAAIYVPARRATRMNALSALRED
jgi:putative ABC transport system permease protein